MDEPTAENGSVTRVSTLELFFDLVFVFSITQVSDLVKHASGFITLTQASQILMLTWWMYGGYAWLTNSVGTAAPLNRSLLLAAMAGFLVMALAVPRAFAGDVLCIRPRVSARESHPHSPLFTRT